MADFEVAIWNAINEIFPDTVTFSCHFHFKQVVCCWLMSMSSVVCDCTSDINFVLVIEHCFGNETTNKIMEDVDRLFYVPSEEEFYHLSKELMKYWKKTHNTFAK